MQEQLLNSNNLKEKLKSLGNLKRVTPNVQSWLDTVAHKHWLKVLPQEKFTGSINEGWFQQKSQNTIFKQLIITPQFTSEVNHLIDFLNQNYQIKKDDEVVYKPLNKLNYLECQRQAQKWIDKINDKVSLEEDYENLKEIEKIDFEGQEYTLFELVSRQNLLREGKLMNNCISTYATKSDEENKNTKFYSIRDKNNKSLVSMSGKRDDYGVTDLERSEWINSFSMNSLNSMDSGKRSSYKDETNKEKIEREKKESKQAILEYDIFLNETKEKRGPLFIISEIKEKNNELLDIHSFLVKKMINKILKKKGSLGWVFPHVLDEIDLIELNYKNELHTPEKLKVDAHYEIVSFDELSDKNYKMISYLPIDLMKKMQKVILNKPNSIDFDLMKKTNWINVKDCSYEFLSIKNNMEIVRIENSEIKSINYEEQNVNQFTFLNNCKNLKINVSYANNLIIKDSNNIKFEKSRLLDNNIKYLAGNYVTLINCTIDKISVKKPDENYTGVNFLLIDSKNFTNDSNINLTNLFYIDTDKNEIKSRLNKIHKVDIYNFVKANYNKPKVGLPSYSLNEYMKEKIIFEKIDVVSDINSLNIETSNLFNLKISIPCKDKSLILKLIEDPEAFKEIIANNLLKKDKNLYENEFINYKQINILQDFYDLIEIRGKKEFTSINEKFKDNPNELDYSEIINQHINALEEGNDISVITPTQVEKLKIIKATYLECLDSSRMNKSRTKLNKSFTKNLVFRIESNLLNGRSFTDDSTDFIIDVLSSPVDLSSKVKHTI